jgi:hypothetical protein
MVHGGPRVAPPQRRLARLRAMSSPERSRCAIAKAHDLEAGLNCAERRRACRLATNGWVPWSNLTASESFGESRSAGDLPIGTSHA